MKNIDWVTLRILMNHVGATFKSPEGYYWVQFSCTFWYSEDNFEVLWGYLGITFKLRFRHFGGNEDTC